MPGATQILTAKHALHKKEKGTLIKIYVCRRQTRLTGLRSERVHKMRSVSRERLSEGGCFDERQITRKKDRRCRLLKSNDIRRGTALHSLNCQSPAPECTALAGVFRLCPGFR
jgi:hypothetical protein